MPELHPTLAKNWIENPGKNRKSLVLRKLQNVIPKKNMLSNFGNSLTFIAIAPFGARQMSMLPESAWAQNNKKQTTSEEPDEV